jgi:uncharacterized cupredoxin-like copper-binding protein
MTPRNDARPSGPERAFDRLLILVGIIGAAAAVLAAVAAIRAGSAEAVTPEDETQTVSYRLTEFAIEGNLSLTPGPVVFNVMNDGAIAHNLTIEGGPSTPDLDSGDSTSLDVGDLAAGTYTIFCSIPGHRESGMEETLVVSEDGAAHDDHGVGADWAALDQSMLDSMLAFPAETEGRGNQPLAPTILADGTKEFRLTVAITEWEVEPGKFVEAWTYNGMVPGPQLRVDVGDRVRVVVDNQLPASTDIHWHGVMVPNSQDGVSPYTQDPIGPGETFTYEFTTREPAIAMYHAHLHGQVAIPNGLFGTILVGEVPLPTGQTISGKEIPANLVVSQEIPMVLNDAGVIGLSLNGKSFPATEPYVGTVGDWVVVHYFNEGLQIHPMHQHQFPQLVYAKDGIPLEHPYWADVVNVAPGERYSVLYQLADAGVWVWHCHILTHAERDEGMFGMVTAFIVEDA